MITKIAIVVCVFIPSRNVKWSDWLRLLVTDATKTHRAESNLFITEGCQQTPGRLSGGWGPLGLARRQWTSLCERRD